METVYDSLVKDHPWLPPSERIREVRIRNRLVTHDELGRELPTPKTSTKLILTIDLPV